jgi:hypothetical protein
MGTGVWERFDTIATPTEVNEAKSKFEPPEAGVYNVILEELAPSESKNGLPMLKGKFRTTEGNKTIFYNQMLQNVNNTEMTAVNIAEAVKFMSGITNDEIEFTGLSALAETVEKVTLGNEYVIDVSYGKKDLVDMKFPKIRVVRMESADTVAIKDDDLPF